MLIGVAGNLQETEPHWSISFLCLLEVDDSEVGTSLSERHAEAFGQ
jgi:hypothetical protein